MDKIHQVNEKDKERKKIELGLALKKTWECRSNYKEYRKPFSWYDQLFVFEVQRYLSKNGNGTKRKSDIFTCTDTCKDRFKAKT